MAASAAAIATGAAENVEVCTKGSLPNGWKTSWRATMAETGMTPPDSALPTSSMSGTIPSRSAPHQVPRRPSPVCTSSSTSSAPWARQEAATSER